MQPQQYLIHLEPDLESLTFTGHVGIHFNPTVPPAQIQLDALDLQIAECAIVAGDEERAVRWEHAGGILSIATGDSAGAAETGALVLRIRFSGELNDKLVGFYRSSYSVNGEPRYLATTQFEERDARRAFPCVDQPAAKAVFLVELLAPAGCSAIANTPVASTEAMAEGATLFRFEPTPPMSTYLLYFGVGPFEIQTDESWRVPIRVAVSPGEGARSLQSLEYARQSVSYLESLVGVPYPLAKLDSIGVRDFAFGAMENFGAIAYREHLLLTDEHTTRAEIEKMMSIAAHEIAHMWFGDLVSPAAWRYVWLNEAFATYFGNLAAEHWYPQWRMLARFAGATMGLAMDRDGHAGTVPIELEDDEIEINPSTAPIVYNKGACVLRMLHEFYGDGPFMAATQSFLSRYAYGAVGTEEFVEEFGSTLDREARSGEDLEVPAPRAAQLLHSWIRTPGFPLVRVTRTGNTLSLRRSRFGYLPPEPGNDESWVVPVTAVTQQGRTYGWILDQAEQTVALEPDDGWVKLNRNQAGYYRVYYEEAETWDALGDAARAGSLDALDRYALIADLAAFVRAGMVPLERYLQFLSQYYAAERDPIVVTEIATALSWFAGLLPEDARISAAATTALSPHRERLLAEPREDEPYDLVLMRDAVLWALVTSGDDAVVASLAARAEAFRRGTAVHADTVPLALRAAVLHDSACSQWVRERLVGSELSEAQQLQFLRALAEVRDPATVTEVLTFVAEHVPYRNLLHFLMPAARNPVVSRRLWAWFRTRAEDLADIHPYHLAAAIVLIVATGGLGHESEVAEFLNQRFGATVEPGVITLALNRLEVNRRLVDRERR